MLNSAPQMYMSVDNIHQTNIQLADRVSITKQYGPIFTLLFRLSTSFTADSVSNAIYSYSNSLCRVSGIHCESGEEPEAMVGSREIS